MRFSIAIPEDLGAKEIYSTRAIITLGYSWYSSVLLENGSSLHCVETIRPVVHDAIGGRGTIDTFSCGKLNVSVGSLTRNPSDHLYEPYWK